jgi:transforming growth factor-beta-induced protein
MAGFRLAARFPLSLCLLLAVLLGPATLVGCIDDSAAPELTGDNLLELVTSAEDLGLIREILGNLAVSGTLRSGSDLTFFAPTDEALLSLGTEMLARLRTPDNEAILDKLVRRHVVPGRFRLADLRDGMTLDPLEGPPLAVRVDGEDVTVGGALITDDEFTTGNGVLFQVDEVVRDHLTLAERLRVTPIISTFADALDTADLTDAVTDGEPYTLFIPVNSAFLGFTPLELQALLSFDNRDVLTRVLRHHVVPGRVRIDDLATGTTLDALDGMPLDVIVEDGLVYVGGARVVIPEVETSDGLIYLLDTVVVNHLTIRDRMRIAPEFATTLTILRDAGVIDELDADGAYTVFAPTDATWEVLGLPFLPELNARPDLLLRTAQYAVVPERIDPEELLTGRDLTTLGDYDLPILIRQDVGGPQVFVGGRAQVDPSAREARNGFLYTVAPFYYPPDLDLEERAVFTGLYRFLALMERAGLTSLLQEPGPYTVFAPDDRALNGVNIPDFRLADLLRYHILPGRLPGSTISTTPRPYRTLEGSLLELLRLGSTNLGLNCEELPGPPPMIVCEARVRSADNSAENGIIHTINGVLEIPTP